MAESAKKTAAKKTTARKTAAKKTAPGIPSQAPPPETTAAVPAVAEAELVAEELAVPAVLSEADPVALEALEREDVVTAFRAAKEAGQAWREADGAATQAKKSVAVKIMDLRELFQIAGFPDWDGRSAAYQAVARLLYQDLGITPAGQRAIRHHVEDLKRERIPRTLWSGYGVDELPRGQRAQVEKQAAQSVQGLAAAQRRARRRGTAVAMLDLARQIRAGTQAVRTEIIPGMSPDQRRVLADQVTQTEAEMARIRAALAEAEPDFT